MAERAGGKALENAARAWGVLPSYEGQDGAPVRASERALLAALRELGAPVETPDHVPAALHVRRVERWAQLVEPVVVSWEGQRAEIEVRLLAGEATDALRCELALEDGAIREWSVRAQDLADLRSADVDGRAHVHGRLALPADLPLGYHDLTVRVGPRHARARVLCAPRHAWTPEGDGPTPRDWGAFLPLHALRTSRSHGVADLSDLEALQLWTGGHGGAVVGTLPLLATFLERPFDPSPYAPVSRLFWNELYLNPELLPGLDRAPGAGALLESAGYRSESERLRRAPAVDYHAAYALRRRVLEALVGEIAPADEPLPVDLAEYRAASPEAEAYAAFRAIGEREGRAWRDWPGHVRAGSVGERDVDETAYRRHLFAQWAMDRQLRAQAHGAAGSRASLYMDLPIGTHPDGYEWDPLESTCRHASLSIL